MRIGKERLVRSHARAAESFAIASPQMDTSQQLELEFSSRGLSEKVHESSAVEQCHDRNDAEGSCGMEKAPVDLLEKMQIGSARASSGPISIPSDRPYMNLDEFVSCLARKNCFPADHPDSGDGIVSSSINDSVQTNDDVSQDFERLFGDMSSESDEAFRGDIAAVETSLRLGVSPHEKGCMAAYPHNSAFPRTTTLNLEFSDQEMEAAAASQADQTMKSSTASEEQRSGMHTRVSSSTGRKRGRLSSPTSFLNEQSDDTWDYSEKKRTLVPASSFTLQIAHGNETTNHQTGQQLKGTSENKRMINSMKARKKKTKQEECKAAGAKRSGRPKKLKYLKQENVEELGNQCNRSDGKGWMCPLLAKPGYQLCDHHLNVLRCKPGSRSKYNKGNNKKTKTKKKMQAASLV